MPLSVGTGAGARDVTEIYVGTGAGVRTVTEGYIGTGAGVKPFYSATPALDPLSAYASPGAIFWSYNGYTNFSDQAAGAIPSGGSGSYSYAWEIDVGNVIDPTSQGTYFQSDTGGFAVASCLVTDLVTNEAVLTNFVTIS